MAAFGLRKAALRLRLELAGRTICEGRTDAMPPEVRIGRAADCEWRIPPTDKTASNHHARLYQRRGKWWVEDTGSRNGLYCKGEKVASWCLAAGDQVSIGDCVLAASLPDERAEGKAEHHRLEQLNGADAGRTVELDREITVIGSGATCDIACDDNLVSHRHAELACKKDGTCWVKDLKSRNGTRVNRVPLKAAGRMLRDGDVLSVAYIDFRFWDKNTVHTPSHVRLRLAVAAMTVLVCLAGWFCWNAVNPSAARFLRAAMKAAETGDFREAMRLTEEARRARNHVAYGPQIDERARNIRQWQKTALAWNEAQRNLSTNKWTTARSNLVQAVKWDWNAGTAMRHQRRAQASERLLDEFLAMRSLLETPSATAAELENARNRWMKALAQAEAEPAVRDEEWKNEYHAEIEGKAGEKNVATNVVAGYERVLAPLVAAGTAIAEEIDTALEEHREFRKRLAELEKPDVSILSRPAETCRDEIDRLYTTNQSRKVERMADKAEKKYKVLRFSALFGTECVRVKDALDDLAMAEGTVARNLETLAALEPGWELHLETELSFPNHTDDPVLLAYRKTLTDANMRLCKANAPTLKNTHLKALDEMGMAEPEQVPAAIERVSRPKTMEEIRRFVDWRVEAPRTWGAGTVVDGCAYDEILGCEYAYEFLESPDENGFGGEDFLKENSPGKLQDGGDPCPLARQAREDFILLKRFLDFLERDSLLNEASSRARLASGKDNRLLAFRKKAQGLLDARKDCLAEMLPATEASGRDGVAAKVLYLMLETDRWSDNERELHKAAHDEYHRLFNAHVTQAREERRGNAVYLDKCVPDAFWFREWREWADNHAAGGVP